MSTAGALSIIAAIQVIALAAAAAAGVVVPAYLLLWGRLRQQARDITGVGAKVAGHETALAVVAAGGALPAAVRPVPRYDQLSDPLPDGSLPTWRYEECGEECCAMVIAAQHGVEIAADALRAQLGGPGRRGLTTGADLVKILARANVLADLQDTPADQVARVLQDTTTARRMAIALGCWVAPGVEHWILVTRADTDGCGANDPWGGRRRIWTWGAFRSAYAGELVIVTRSPDP